MFKINDYVIYNSMGVYKIIDIREEKDINDNDTEYYILKPVYGNNLTIKTPVNNTKVFMREILKKEEVLTLIKSLPEQETAWIDDDRKRSEAFKASLKTGDSEEWAKLIKTIYLEKQKKSVDGKKLMKADEDIMKIAEKNLYEEFAVALNIQPEEVVSYILEHVS
ncbi:MAG: transcriptional regulator [Clostridiaceae bacterium]|nr:transcriptional regulator [Clostridiaceae bacterium]